LAARSSRNRRPTFIIYTRTERGGGNPRVSTGSCEAHHGCCSSSKRGSGGCRGFAWSSLAVGEAEGASGEGVGEGVL
jgi:hypothetical protein